MNQHAKPRNVAAGAAKSWAGETVPALSYPAPDRLHWSSLSIGELLTSLAGSSTIWKVVPPSNPPLLAKLYNDKMRQRLKSETAPAEQLLLLARYRSQLSRELPFAAWPLSLVFSGSATITEDNFTERLAGFTMVNLQTTSSLAQLVSVPRVRHRLKSPDTLHIARTLLGQIELLHAHPWRFVFGDLSASNVRVSNNFKQVFFIDTDSFQFTCPEAGHRSYTAAGTTPSFRSPGIRTQKQTTQLTEAHDTFVATILLFQLIMADVGVPNLHPFISSDSNPDDLIDRYAFPYEQPDRYPVSRYALDKYRALPVPIRKAFRQTFTTKNPVPLGQWRTLLGQHWRSLPRPSA